MNRNEYGHPKDEDKGLGYWLPEVGRMIKKSISAGWITIILKYRWVPGMMCILSSWMLLYIGGTRIVWSDITRRSLPASQQNDGHPVYITVTPEAAPLGDEPHLKRGIYLKIIKQIEIYSWIEYQDEEKNIRYRLDWTSEPEPVSEFSTVHWKKFCDENGIPAAFDNIPSDKVEKNPAAISTPVKMEKYFVDTADITYYGNPMELRKVYIRGNAGNPKPGDKRIAYSARGACCLLSGLCFLQQDLLSCWIISCNSLKLFRGMEI